MTIIKTNAIIKTQFQGYMNTKQANSRENILNELVSFRKDKAILVKYLAQGYKSQNRYDRDSNSNSADQKHQSLSLVL